MSFRVLLNTSLALATGNLWVWVFNMTFNKSPRNTAVDNYVINTSRGFRWRLICSFDPLLGSWESLVPLTRSLQIFKAERALQVPAHVCLHLRLHLYTCMCYTRTHTHEHIHTNTRAHTHTFWNHQMSAFTDTKLILASRTPRTLCAGVIRQPVGMVPGMMAGSISAWLKLLQVPQTPSCQYSAPHWLHECESWQDSSWLSLRGLGLYSILAL